MSAGSESNLVTHAKREFKVLGYKPVEECTDEEDGPNKWIQENVIELLEVFSKQGHSGSSAPYVASMFKKLALFEPIAALTGDDNEWNNNIDPGVFQNNRCSAVFKDVPDSKPYYLDALIWKTQNDGSFSGTAYLPDGTPVKSRQFISFPFIPKSFAIDVIEEEISKDDWLFKVKDSKQLDEALAYFKL